MSRSIELFSRMFESRSVTADERGRQTLTGDVIIATFARVQHDEPLGFDLLMAKYVNDEFAAERLVDAMSKWLDNEPLKRKDLAMALACVALDVFCGRPVASQQRKLQALWRKYSEQGRRSSRLIKRWQCNIKQLDRDLSCCQSQSARERLLSIINETEALIAKERLRLDRYAQTQSQTRSICPRCHGTGIATHAVMCPSCNSSGFFMPTVDNVRQHLRQIGAGRVSDRLWESELQPWFESCIYRMHVESQSASSLMTRLLRAEKLAD